MAWRSQKQTGRFSCTFTGKENISRWFIKRCSHQIESNHQVSKWKHVVLTNFEAVLQGLHYAMRFRIQTK